MDAAASAQRRGERPYRPGLTPGTLPSALQDAIYQRHLPQPLLELVAAIRDLSESQAVDLYNVIYYVEPQVGSTFSNLLGALRQVRRAEFAFANRTLAPFEPSFTELPGSTSVDTLNSTTATTTTTAAAAITTSTVSSRSQAKRRRSRSSSNKIQAQSRRLSSASSSSSTATQKNPALTPVKLVLSNNDFPERPLPDISQQAATKVISLRLDTSAKQKIKRLTRKDEIQNELKEKEWVSLMDPVSRNAWAAERFYILQQCPCKEYVVGLIREIDPVKQQKTPYRQKGTEVIDRPSYWPKDTSVRHTVTPSHLKKEERVDLLVHLLFLPDNDPDFYERWKAEVAKSKTRQYDTWAEMLKFVADGTTFRTDGPKLTPKAKAMSRGYNLDSSGALCMDPDGAVVQLDRSKFDVKADEMARINARVEMIGHLIGAAAKVEAQSGGGVSDERTKLPGLPDYFFKKELSLRMRRTRIRTGRKRKRSPDDEPSANVTKTDPAEANEMGNDDASDTEVDDDYEDDPSKSTVAEQEKDQMDDDDASESYSVAATEAFSMADFVNVGEDNGAESDNDDVYSTGAPTELASEDGDPHPPAAVSSPLQPSQPTLPQQHAQQHAQRTPHQMSWSMAASQSHVQHMSYMANMQSPTQTFMTSFQSDASSYLMQTAAPQDVFNTIPQHPAQFLEYAAPAAQVPDPRLVNDPSWHGMRVALTPDQQARLIETAASSSFGSESYGVGLTPHFYADDGASY